LSNFFPASLPPFILFVSSSFFSRVFIDFTSFLLTVLLPFPFGTANAKGPKSNARHLQRIRAEFSDQPAHWQRRIMLASAPIATARIAPLWFTAELVLIVRFELLSE
jgi:hypothetical protein